jgi:hypothetical protein
MVKVTQTASFLMAKDIQIATEYLYGMDQIGHVFQWHLKLSLLPF